MKTVEMGFYYSFLKVMSKVMQRKRNAAQRKFFVDLRAFFVTLREIKNQNLVLKSTMDFPYLYRILTNPVKMKCLSLLILLLLGSLLVKSQYSYFNEEYNNDLNSGATGIFETGSGYIIGGWSEIYENGIGMRKVLITTIDFEGNQLSWETFGEWGWQYYVSQTGAFTKLSDGGYTLCGTILNDDESAAFLMRFDQNGDSLWIKTYYDGIPLQDTLYSPFVCRELPDKGFILAGQVYNSPGGDNDFLLRTDSLGNKLWINQYGVDGWMDGAVSVTLLPDGGFLAGTVRMSPLNNYIANAGLLKTDSLGNMIWLKFYGGEYEDGASVVTLADDGNYLVGNTYAVYEYYPGYPEQRTWIFKTDTAGNVLWDKTYARCNFMGFCSKIEEMNNGNILMSGLASYTDGFGTYGFLLKTDSEGDSLWMHDYSLYPQDENYLQNFCLTSDNGIILTGCTFGPPLHVPSVWAEKLDDLGLIVGIDEQGSGGAGKQGSLEVWPNPATEGLSVKCSGLSSGIDYELVIYDIFGRLATVRQISLPPGVGRAGDGGWQMDVSSLPPGIYIAVIKNDKGVWANRKFMISR